MLNKEKLLKIFEKYKNASTGGIYMTKWDAMADDIISSQNSSKPVVSGSCFKSRVNLKIKQNGTN